MSSMTARNEWAKGWPVTLSAMVGVSSGTLFAYTSGVFMKDITSAFGWTRAQYSSVFVVQMTLGLIALPLVGRLIDKIGPRRVVLIGMLPFVVCFAALGLATGSYPQWVGLFVLLAICQAMVAQTVWVAAVVTRFEVARGMALAVTLAGLGLGSFIWPVLAATYIDLVGWRSAFALLALTWLIVAGPLCLIFFHANHFQLEGEMKKQPESFARILRSRSFVGLAVGGGLFSCSMYGISVHLVPIMEIGGMDLKSAAGVVGLLGVFSVLGRLGTGYILDKVPTRPVAVVSFLIPVSAVSLLLLFPESKESAIGAVILLGLASGAEIDVITFIAARTFQKDMFGSVYAIFMALIAASASIGPVIAGSIFDAYRSYDGYLLLMLPMAAVSAALIAWIPLRSDDEHSLSPPAHLGPLGAVLLDQSPNDH